MLAEYVGFTEEEVISLYEEYGMDFEEAKRWYDGYHLTESLHIYNPKSAVDSVRRKKIGNYWTSTETYESLKYYIGMNFDGLKDAIIQMVAGGRCKIDTNTFENDMVSFRSRDDVILLPVLIALTLRFIPEDVMERNRRLSEGLWEDGKPKKWYYAIPIVLLWFLIIWQYSHSSPF